MRGVAVSATNRDNIETYSVGLAGGTVGVAVAAAVNVVNTDTHAYIGDGASVNVDQAKQRCAIGPGQRGQRFSPCRGGGRCRLRRGRRCAWRRCDGGQRRDEGGNPGKCDVNAKNDVRVEAHASEDLLMIGMGIAAGTVGVGGGVSVLSVSNDTYASIAGKYRHPETSWSAHPMTRVSS